MTRSQGVFPLEKRRQQCDRKDSAVKALSTERLDGALIEFQRQFAAAFAILSLATRRNESPAQFVGLIAAAATMIAEATNC